MTDLLNILTKLPANPSKATGAIANSQAEQQHNQRIYDHSKPGDKQPTDFEKILENADVDSIDKLHKLQENLEKSGVENQRLAAGLKDFLQDILNNQIIRQNNPDSLEINPGQLSLEEVSAELDRLFEQYNISLGADSQVEVSLKTANSDQNHAEQSNINLNTLPFTELYNTGLQKDGEQDVLKAGLPEIVNKIDIFGLPQEDTSDSQVNNPLISLTEGQNTQDQSISNIVNTVHTDSEVIAGSVENNQLIGGSGDDNLDKQNRALIAKLLELQQKGISVEDALKELNIDGNKIVKNVKDSGISDEILANQLNIVQNPQTSDGHTIVTAGLVTPQNNQQGQNNSQSLPAPATTILNEIISDGKSGTNSQSANQDNAGSTLLNKQLVVNDQKIAKPNTAEQEFSSIINSSEQNLNKKIATPDTDMNVKPLDFDPTKKPEISVNDSLGGLKFNTQTKHITSAPEEVSFRIYNALKEGNSKIEIKMNPPELGKVEVNLNVNRAEGKAHLVITADRADTLAMLKDDAKVLAKALMDVGFKSDSTSLSFQLNGNGAQFKQQQASNGNGHDSQLNSEGAADNDFSQVNSYLPGNLGFVSNRALDIMA